MASNKEDDHFPSECIDPCSTQFDPVAALNAPSIPGLQNVQPLANLSKFEEYQSDPEAFLKNEEDKKQKSDIRKESKLKSKQIVELQQPVIRRPLKNVLTRMERIEGPTSCLRKWVNERCRVKVITRSFKGIRGTCAGFIVAFDKYLNLAMVDVDEVYSSLLRPPDQPRKKRGHSKEANNPPPIITDTSDPEVTLLTKRVETLHITPCNNVQKRHLKQVFIRGDNVVSVSCL